MRTKAKTFVGMAACAALLVSVASAQESSTSGRSALDETLYRSVCERVQAPIVFSTRDTLFALSLPTDEPAEVYLQLTVGKNGKVKEKLTKVHANHIAGYVAPAFVAAAKELRIDKDLLAGLQGKDTSVLLTFPLEYQCVYDTVNKVWLSAGDRLREVLYRPYVHYEGGSYTNTQVNRELDMQDWTGSAFSIAERRYREAKPTRIWYYLAFIKDQPK